MAFSARIDTRVQDRRAKVARLNATLTGLDNTVQESCCGDSLGERRPTGLGIQVNSLGVSARTLAGVGGLGAAGLDAMSALTIFR